MAERYGASVMIPGSMGGVGETPPVPPPVPPPPPPPPGGGPTTGGAVFRGGGGATADGGVRFCASAPGPGGVGISGLAPLISEEASTTAYFGRLHPAGLVNTTRPR